MLTPPPAEMTVNGVKVSSSKANEDGTYSYILEDSLFDHGTAVNVAWEENLKTAPIYDPFGTLISG